MDYASLCFLSFNRPRLLRDAVTSAVENAQYPTEVIVHDDGSDLDTRDTLLQLLDDGLVSKLILSPLGQNEGVGAAFNRAVAVSTGDPVCKLDQDLVFNQGWLRKTVGWLENDVDVAMFGLFKYHVDPVDWRKMNHRQPPPEIGDGAYEYVDDFVGSAMVIPREILDEYGPLPEHSDAFAEDVEYKTMLQERGLELALPCEDLARNVGFGLPLSTVCLSDGRGGVNVRKIHHEPLIIS